jgi:tetratricopeptide (TPR) repeat protein
MFEKNLRRVPLDQAAVMHVDALFLPRPKLVKNGPGEGGSLRKALAQAHSGDDPGAPRAVRREYPLPASDAAARDAQVRKVMADLRQVLAEAPPDADTRLGMNLTFTRARDVGREDAAQPPKVSFEPRQVGNDMGLWVIGTGWMALVAEVLPDSGEAGAPPSDADGWTAMGLAHAAVGEGQRAGESFLKATELDPKSAPAWLGRGVAAAMSGDEGGAIAALRKALEIEPKNKTAKDGLNWLERPAAKEKEKR